MVNNKPATIALILLLLFISGSIWLVFKYVSAEEQRDLDAWQSRLSIMAESQQYAVEAWFDEQLENMDALANNPLLQLYVTQQDLPVTEDDETGRGQLHHLKNLINATADHADVFTPIKKINSNVENEVNDGIAIVNRSGVLLATRYFPLGDAEVAASFQTAIDTKSFYISTIYDSAERHPRFIIVVPVRSVQSLSPDDIKAAVVAVINPEDNLYELLLKDWVTIRTEETLLVSYDDNRVNYLSPLKNGYQLFHSQPRRGDVPAKNIAASTVLENIGENVMVQDYRNVDVLATARKIRNTSMTLVQKIDVSEALAESNSHQQFILTIFLLAVFVITISFIAIWRHSTSLRLQKATRRLEARAALLNAVGDSINDHIFLLDHNNKLVFINDALARSFSIDNVDVRGKALNHIFSTDITKQLLKLKPADGEADVRNREMRLELKDRRRDYHVSIVALRHPDYKQSHLYVMHDITELKDAQGRHNRLMEGIISTLAQVIDKHDPHCAHHSERTREVATAIARAMDLPKERIDILSMAALLANIGKLYIPAEVLTNMEPLTQAEELMLRENINYSVEILKDLEFDGPVIEFVQQKNECLDGSGYPNGVSGDAIFQESRILSVANAFVAMTSSRAYRPGKPVKEVLDILLSEADSRYDRHVIAALFHVAENHSDWVSWQQVN
ncbi:MAG: PAS domain S-box protein [Gammaproteobacteria bacterium]|nr:PAS domain S-box protein [Gammaproteobacteria bacterium]